MAHGCNTPVDDHADGNADNTYYLSKVPAVLHQLGKSRNENDNVDNTYYPSISDVCKTREVLHQLGKSRNENKNGIGLPTELVDMIIDEAEYWPSVLTEMPKPVIVQDSTDKRCLLTPPLCYDLVCLACLT